MNNGGDASEQIVRIMLEGAEVAIKLTGSATKNVAGALYALYKDNKKFKKGKASLTEILKDGKETRIFRMDTKDLADFKKYAKQYGIRYAAIKESSSKDSLCDVIVKSQDIPRVNHVLGKMDYVDMSPPKPVAKEQSDPKKENQQRNNSNTQKSKSTQKDRADLQEVLKNINENKKENITPEKYKAYLMLQSQMYNYSHKNKERILSQNPSASVVMSKTKWREIGRFPMQGASGIMITMPEYEDGNRTGKFIDVKVYDISETYGKDIDKSSLNFQLKSNTPEIKSEIDRIKSSSTVPIETKSDLETDAYYNSEDEIIYIRDDLSDTDIYKALVLEQSYANAHSQQGDNYIRGNNRLTAESCAFMIASKYGIDAQELRFDYIPDEVNGSDGKDLKELFNPIVTKGCNEIHKADKNLDKFKKKEKESVVVDLKAHKKGIEKGTFKSKISPNKLPNLPKGKER